jgi:hypothetical protein
MLFIAGIFRDFLLRFCGKSNVIQPLGKYTYLVPSGANIAGLVHQEVKVWPFGKAIVIML